MPARSLVLLVLVGCGGAVVRDIQTIPDDQLAPAVKVTGNVAYSTKVLREVVAGITCDARHELEVTIARALDPEPTPACKSLDDLVATLDVFYRAHGFVAAKVRGSAGIPSPVIRIEEGGLFHVGTVELVEDGGSASDVLGDAAAIATLLALPRGAPFVRDTIRGSLERVRARYDAAGYGLANVTPITRVDQARRIVDLRLEVVRGAVSGR